MKLLITFLTILSFAILPSSGMAMGLKKVQTEQSMKVEKAETKKEMMKEQKESTPQQSKKEIMIGGGCCQCRNSCSDVTRASQCRGLCGPGGGTYKKGKTCKRNTCK